MKDTYTDVIEMGKGYFSMRFDLDMGDPEQNVITAYDDHCVKVNDTDYRDTLLISPTTLICPWGSANFSEMTETEIQEIIALKPEIVIIGTGQTQRFLSGATLAAFARHGVGFEVMNTRAACHTYNILMSEQRKVVAVIRIDGH